MDLNKSFPRDCFANLVLSVQYRQSPAKLCRNYLLLHFMHVKFQVAGWNSDSNVNEVSKPYSNFGPYKQSLQLFGKQSAVVSGS